MSSSSSAATTDITNVDKAREKWKQFYARLIEQTRFGSEEKNENFLLTYLMAGEEDLGELNEEKQQALVQALRDADWEAPILNDENLEQIALQCFKDTRITYQQLITLLERQQYQLDFGAIETHALLDENEEYTDYAKVVFLSVLQRILKERQGLEVDEKGKERLRYLIAALPRSEQIVYGSIIDETKLYEGGVLPIADMAYPSDSLLGRMEREGIMLLDFANYYAETVKLHDNTFTVNLKKIPLISMSDGVADAVSIALFGVKRYVNPVFRTGKLNVRDIEQGIEREFRPTAITLKNDPPPKQIHEFKNPGRVPATAHDRYHAGIMSRMTIEFRRSLLYMIDIARGNLRSMHETEQMEKKQKQSTLVTLETWIAVDAAWPISKGISVFSKKEMEQSTQEFCKNLDSVTIASKGGGAISDNYSGFFDSEDNVSVFGMIIFVDMLRNRDQWCQLFNIDPELLNGQFKIGYEFIKRLSIRDAHFLNDSPELQALKLKVVQEIGDVNDNDLCDLLKEIENYYHDPVNKSNPICDFAREKQGGNLFNQKLLPNQVGLFIHPGHEAFFSEIHGKYFHGKEFSESLSDDEVKISNKCCCFFNSAKKKSNSSESTMGVVVEGEKTEEENNSPFEMEVVREDGPAKQSKQRSCCDIL